MATVAAAPEIAVPDSIWREYDVRGVAGTDLTPGLARLLGQAFAQLTLDRGAGHEALVGRDNRTSSPELAAALIEGLRDGGLAVRDLGQVTTPVFYFARLHLGVEAGVMVTASHNPGRENGFKLALGRGTLVGPEITALGAEVRRLAAAGAAAAAGPRPPLRQADVLPAYCHDIVRRVTLPRPLHVVVDCGNGTASPITPEVFRRLGCRVTELFCESDPTFPNHHPDPVRPENLRALIAAVRETGADLGIGIDGDGDRIGAVADDGRILWGDELMMLFWREILPRHPGSPVLVEVKCSQALWDDAAAHGGRPFFHRTGHSHIKATLYAQGLPFAGELSGHLFFHDEFPGYDDATYAGARLARLVASSGRPLSELAAELPRYASTPEVRVACPDAVKFDVVERLRRGFEAHHEVVAVDGARVLFPHGWGLVRASNTQPVLVVRAEGRDAAALEAICAEMEAALAAQPEVGPVSWAG